MTKIYLIRHGETDWNEEGRLQGQKDIALNAHGIEQAQETAERLSQVEFAAVYASDLRRAYQTAEIIAGRLGAPLQIDARLREVCLGEWEGRLVQELNQSEDDRFARRFKYPAMTAPPGGETAQQVQARLLAVIDAIVSRHPGGTVAVVTHGFAVAVLLSAFRDIPLDQVWDLIPTNGQIHIVEKETLWNSPN